MAKILIALSFVTFGKTLTALPGASEYLQLSMLLLLLFLGVAVELASIDHCLGPHSLHHYPYLSHTFPPHHQHFCLVNV